MLGSLTGLSVLALLVPALVSMVISQTAFTAIVGLGILGTMVVGIIIIAYTVREFRNHEIW